MHKSRLALLLLSPSLLSGFTSCLFSVLIIGITNWSYVKHVNGSYEYLFGPYGITTALQNSTNALSAVNGIFASPTAYNIAVALFAVFIGLLIYVFLEGTDHIAAKTSEALLEVKLINDEMAKKKAEHQAEIRLGLRIATLIVWIFYLIFFSRVIIPLCILLGRSDNSGHLLLTWNNVLAALSAVIVLVISMHVHVIFMRLLVLRPRLLGGDAVLIGRGGHEE